jgi:hypothetical protein
MYIVIGLVFFVSPLSVLTILAENVSESWLDLVMDNELVAPLFFISRGFAALLITSGLAMVMPLFDPLKYRALVYFNGLLFTFLASLMFVKNGVLLSFFNTKPLAAVQGAIPLATGRQGHLILVILGLVFLVLFILNAAALVITGKQSKDGLE